MVLILVKAVTFIYGLVTVEPMVVLVAISK
jgi:hypothetical protein